MNTFENMSLSNNLLQAIQKLGFTNPTEIQEKSIPHIVKGKDLIGESATGSGKTLAFGCSIAEHVKPNEGLQALILAPTRELAEQVRNSIKELTPQLKVMSIYGGVSINPQIDNLRKVDVVVATPGRLLDHLQRRTVNLSKIKILVLDEADRMLDMGFIDDVERIIRVCPKERQTLFFSATISSKIKTLANRYMKDSITILAERQVDPSKLKQVYYNVMKHGKLALLVHLLKTEISGLAIIFCNTRNTTDFVNKNLRANKVDAVSIHGGLSQNKRSGTIEMFNKGKVGVLVCTDVAARGLHIENVSHVCNYEIPKDAKDYVHRIGRTARAGEEGMVMNLICELDHDNFGRVLREYRTFNVEKLEKPHTENIVPIKSSNFGQRPRRNNFGGHRRSFGNRRNSNPRSSGPRSFGNRKNSESDRGNSDQKSFGNRRNSGPRSFGDKKRFSSRPRFS
ncbi:MAG: DEAD/DEAH box helicase [Nanoarchaeota archaeon]|nr:DEAD/DEAH box helicase [Nanoarchaeota archaeon]MBU4352689.1 DEAD/DEAH box helicase [Nanoarchaeota archaeon]MBU4456931.1 DEAD/DEAH box helicase [Nanoarchaeota archaeon]MCG2719214.1 DEAD/DEAH box helicase [Nanoarchaeota archaeon]